MPDTNTALEAPKPGFQTTEFKLTVGGMFLGAILSFCASFGLLHLTPEQTESIYQLTGISWVVLPVVYSALRAHTKSTSLKAIAAVEVAKQETKTAKEQAK